MREFEREFKIGHEHLGVYIAKWNDIKDKLPAICSGLPFSPIQYLLLDYDENYCPNEWQRWVDNYGLRRSLVIESSPKRYWNISFSFMRYLDVLKIMWKCSADRDFCSYMMLDGYVGIRVKEKVVGYPKLLYEIVNDKTSRTVRYNYDLEDEVRKNFGWQPAKIPVEVTQNG